MADITHVSESGTPTHYSTVEKRFVALFIKKCNFFVDIFEMTRYGEISWVKAG